MLYEQNWKFVHSCKLFCVIMNSIPFNHFIKILVSAKWFHSTFKMSRIPSSNNKKCDISEDGKLKPPPLINAPRLQVPTISVTDKTPTPTKLLKAADEIGLFQDVYLSRDSTPQKG